MWSDREPWGAIPPKLMTMESVPCFDRRTYDDIMIIKWPLFFGIQPPGLLLVLCSQIVANHHGRKLRLYIYITVVRREPEATKTLDFMGHRGYELSKNLRFCLGHWWSWQLGRSFRQCGLIATSKIWGVYHGFLPCLTMFYPSGYNQQHVIFSSKKNGITQQRFGFRHENMATR